MLLRIFLSWLASWVCVALLVLKVRFFFPEVAAYLLAFPPFMGVIGLGFAVGFFYLFKHVFRMFGI